MKLIKGFLVLAFLIVVSCNLYSQSTELHGDAFLSNLEAYRLDLLDGRESDFGKIDSVHGHIASRYRSHRKTHQLIYRVIYAGILEEQSYQEYVTSLLAKDENDKIGTYLKQEEYDLIVKHHHLIDFKRTIAMRYRSPFLIDTVRILKELEFYQFKENDICADIGTGSGNFGLLMAALDLDLKIYLTDVKLNYLNVRVEEWLEYDFLDTVRIIKGSKDKLNLPVTCDKIIMRNTLHHIKEYEEILIDVADRLNPGGVLIVKERIPSKKRKDRKEECSKRLKGSQIEKRLSRGGFKITRKKQIGNSNFYRCIPIER